MEFHTPDNPDEVIQELRRFNTELEYLAEKGDRRQGISSFDVEGLQHRLATIKDEISKAAKTGTVGGVKRPLTETEQYFFSRSIQKASANFRLRANANPRNSGWVAGLFDVQSDISYALFQIEKHYPDSES